MSFTAKSSADPSASSMFGQCTNPGFAFFAPLANAFASLGTSSSLQKNIWASTSVAPAPAPTPGGNVASNPLFGRSTSSEVGASPTPTFGEAAATGGSSFSPFGTSVTSFGNPPSAFGVSLAPNSGTKSSADPSASSMFGQCTNPGFSFGAPSANASSSFGTSSSPQKNIWASTSVAPAPAPVPGGNVASTPLFGRSTSSEVGASPTPTFGAANGPSSFSPFVSSVSSFGNSSSAFGASLAPNSGSFQTAASSFASSTLSFGVAATPNSNGSRAVGYAATQEYFGGHPEIVSISAMKIHSNKSHEELRATDYQLGDKGGPFNASISRGSTGVADTQQKHWSFPAATSNTSSHSHGPGFSFTPQPSMSTISNEWPSAPCRVCEDAKGLFASQSSVSMARVFPLVPDQRNPPTLNPFASQTKGVDNEYSGGTSSTKTDSIQNLFPSVKPNSSGWQTFQSGGSRLTAYTETFDQQQGTFQSISAMPMYANKSHEELRLSDYHLGDKGGCKEFLIARTEPTLSTHQNPFVPSASQSSSSTNQFLGPSHNSTCSTTTLPPANQSFPSSLSSDFSFSSIPSTTSFHCSSSTAPPSFMPFFFETPRPAFSPSMPSTVSSGSSGTTSFLNSTDSQPLQSSPLSAPSGSLASLSISAPENTPITAPENISISVMSTTVPPTISSTVTPTLEQQSDFPKMYDPLNMAQIRHPGTTLPIQYGISSRPVTDNPSPAIRTNLLSVRHLSVCRNRLRAEKPKVKSDAPKVAFFTGDEGISVPVNSDSSIIPRKNPGCWISSPSKEFVSKADSQVSRPPRETTTSSQDIMSGSATDVDQDAKVVDDLEVLLPKLMAADYYTEPSISEIAAKEKAEPGFCSRVKDFVVGRVGYGSIKFIGETDISKQDLDSIIKFNHRELLVYFDESMEKPPVGEGLNKPAEVTLLEVKCIGSKNGNQYIDGPKVYKCRERLIKKTTEHGAEFVSYNPVLGEWKFRVQHF